MVSVTLMAGLTLLAGQLMRYGSNYIKNSSAQLELQRGALLALNWMSKDISEGSPIAMLPNSWGSPPVPPQPPTAGPPRGIVLASPRDVNGDIVFSGNSLEWNSRVCYYVDLADQGKLYRATEPHPPEALPRVIDPLVEDTDHFLNNRATIAHRLLAENVTYLDVQRQVAGIEITLEAATETRNFTMLVTTLVHPKN